MMNGDAILEAVVSLREATELGFRRIETEMTAGFSGVARRFERFESRMGALETRLDRFEVKVLQRFDDLDTRLASVERA